MEFPEGSLILTSGKVAVRLDPPRDNVKGILLTHDYAEQRMSDTGVVIGVGSGVNGVTPGVRVVVLPKHGKSIEDYTHNGKVYKGFTRLYGAAGGFSPYSPRGDKRFPATLTDWWLSIPLIIMSPEEYQPTGDWVLLKHELVDQTPAGILMPDSVFIDPRATLTAEIVAVGPKCKEITEVPERGNQFYYWEGAAKHVLGLDKDYVIVREPYVLGQKL